VPGALRPSLGDCCRKECCGSWLSVRLDYPNQHPVHVRVPARADPLTAAELCMLPFGWPRPVSDCSQSAVGHLLGLCACRTTLATAHFKLRSSGWSLVRAGNWPAQWCLMPCRSTTPVHCGCPPSVPHCRVRAANPRSVTACGRHPSQSSLLHRPRLLVSLTCPKPGPNRRCALAGATLNGAK
jgi:hypothetical protein